MDDVSLKIKKFQESCLKLAKEEASSLDEKIENNIKLETEDEIFKYQEEAKNKWLRQENKLEKEFNSKIYKIKNDSKIAIINKEKDLLKSLNYELTQRLYMFTDLKEYEYYLKKNLIFTLKNLEIDKNDKIEIYATAKDIDRYLSVYTSLSTIDFLDNELNNFEVSNLKFVNSSEEIIGGTIGKNITKKIYVDNSLKIALSQEIDNLNLN